MSTFEDGRNIILGVTGSIAAYKACAVLRGLRERGHVVQVVMTDAAQQLVTASTFHALSGRRVITGMWIPQEQVGLEHIQLAEWTDAMAVVPATANFLGKAANGIADDILSCTWMACDCPKLVAPAMNDRMWTSPPVQRNVDYLRELPGVTFVDPKEGRLASGKMAVGHLAPVETIVEAVDLMARNQDTTTMG